MFTFEQYCYDALKLFDRYCLNDQNILIGHSYGTRCVVDICQSHYQAVLFRGFLADSF